ncbi:RnfABCDGE type electron transport complex subunit B [Legionella fairfieldensis]|uniref:RnfABCDGE type electron transport complex subunit B n=1 Tax=Legionella fairfieldensis TaxID=45064 RepID=UPI00048AA0BD|nr:RnfABCDGE type electron transport complex subunit B [Legionella fairfieldensis]
MVSVKLIDALLPQTQCGDCGYAGCLPYAEALAQGKAPIDRCPPGGIATAEALGQLLGIPVEPYRETVEANTRVPAVAVIREAECVGCTKCIQACPVDAIVGSGKLMHSVVMTECTGCGLCVEPCPVDCIELVSVPESGYDKTVARQRFNEKQARLLRDEQARQQSYQKKRQLAAQSIDALQDKQAKQDYIMQALKRVQTKRNNS